MSNGQNNPAVEPKLEQIAKEFFERIKDKEKSNNTFQSSFLQGFAQRMNSSQS